LDPRPNLGLDSVNGRNAFYDACFFSGNVAWLRVAAIALGLNGLDTWALRPIRTLNECSADRRNRNQQEDEGGNKSGGFTAGHCRYFIPIGR
jgi:hypothetical protein